MLNRQVVWLAGRSGSSQQCAKSQEGEDEDAGLPGEHRADVDAPRGQNNVDRTGEISVQLTRAGPASSNFYGGPGGGGRSV